MANLNKEVWQADIKATLERDAAFLSRMTNLSEFVSNEYINIPQSGAATQIFKNVTQFPLAVAQRTDTVEKIKMDQYSTQAFLVTDLESTQLSYSKRDSVMGQHSRKMVEFVGDTVLQDITPTAPARTVQVAGATLAFGDIVNIAKMMDLDNVPKPDRSLELSTEAYYELLQDENILKSFANGFNYSTVETGNVLKVAGISIYERPTVGTALGVAYQKNSVGAAVGTIDFMTDFGDNGNGNPLYLGGIMSAILWLGAGKLRSDSKGIVALTR